VLALKLLALKCLTLFVMMVTRWRDEPNAPACVPLGFDCQQEQMF